jgi:hypothetical protein
MSEHGGGAQHERTDVEPAAVARFGVVLAVVTILVAVGLVYLFRLLAGMEAKNDPPTAPLAHMEIGRVPPEPRLQRLPFVDIEKLRSEEDAALNGYGWVDQEKGIVHIPIRDAMEILVKRGLPVASAAPGPTTGGATR